MTDPIAFDEATRRYWYDLGASAYKTDRMAAPSLDPAVRAALAGREVGDPMNVAIMTAWANGYDAASSAAAEKALNESPPAVQGDGTGDATDRRAVCPQCGNDQLHSEETAIVVYPISVVINAAGGIAWDYTGETAGITLDESATFAGRIACRSCTWQGALHDLTRPADTDTDEDVTP